MNDLQIFENSEFGTVRIVYVDGKPYFAGSDIAKALGYAIPHKAIQSHCKGVLKRNIPTNGGCQDILIIPEGDIYRLIVKASSQSCSESVRERADRFEKWIFDEVLPSIRKNGGYIAGQESLSDDELMAKALMVAQKKIDEKNRLIAMQDNRIQSMIPKEIFADAVSASHTSILIGDLAKLICQNGYQIGQKRLFDWMRDNGFLIKSGSSRNMPQQRYLEQGLFEVKESNLQNPDGSVRITRTTKVTGKGQVYFVNKFLGRGACL